MGVPPAFSFDEKPLHGFPATDEILERASDHVVDARFSIGRRRSFEKDERCVCSAPLDGSLEGLFGGPLLEERRFQVNRSILPQAKVEPCFTDQGRGFEHYSTFCSFFMSRRLNEGFGTVGRRRTE